MMNFKVIGPGFKDLTSHVKLKSLKEYTVRAEGRLTWDFRVDSVTIETRSSIYADLGIALGDVLSLKQAYIEIHHGNQRIFIGWVRRGAWDEKRKETSLTIDSVGMITKELNAGQPHETFEGIATRPFISEWTDEGTPGTPAEIHKNSPACPARLDVKH